MVYAVIATVSSLVFWSWIRTRNACSDLLAAETTGWRVAAFRGVG